jgi:hypothetical protein
MVMGCPQPPRVELRHEPQAEHSGKPLPTLPDNQPWPQGGTWMGQMPILIDADVLPLRLTLPTGESIDLSVRVPAPSWRRPDAPVEAVPLPRKRRRRSRA